MGAQLKPAEKARIIEHVLAELATGRPVSRILAEDEKMCSQQSWWRWVFEDEDLSEKVVRAREAGIEAMLDDTLSIADDGTNDWIEKRRDDGSIYEALNGEHVQRSKLRIETRIKLAQMLKPKTYGPKLDLTSKGEKIDYLAGLEEARRRSAEHDGGNNGSGGTD